MKIKTMKFYPIKLLLSLELAIAAFSSIAQGKSPKPTHYIEFSNTLNQCEALDINYQDNEGRTPLMYAVYNDEMDIVNILIAKGANIDIKEQSGCTALIIASIFSYDSTKALLNAGAIIDVTDNEGKTAADWAFASTNNLALKELIAHGGFITIHNDKELYQLRSKTIYIDPKTSKSVYIKFADNYEISELKKAIVLGDIDTVKTLEPIGDRTYWGSCTPDIEELLRFVLTYGEIEIQDYLIEAWSIRSDSLDPETIYQKAWSFACDFYEKIEFIDLSTLKKK